MTETDPNMTEAVNILHKEKIFFWIGQGSLLGIYRDKKLIEWDHDIDICLWKHENNKSDMIKLLEKYGFKFQEGLEGSENNDSITFKKKGGRNVDINFYVKGKNKDGLSIAFCKWVLPKNKIMKLIDAISNADKYDQNLNF